VRKRRRVGGRAKDVDDGAESNGDVDNEDEDLEGKH
jgi:hypothetical protein